MTTQQTKVSSASVRYCSIGLLVMFNTGVESFDEVIQNANHSTKKNYLSTVVGNLDSKPAFQSKTEYEDRIRANQTTPDEVPTSQTCLGYLLALLSGICFTSMQVDPLHHGIHDFQEPDGEADACWQFLSSPLSQISSSGASCLKKISPCFICFKNPS